MAMFITGGSRGLGKGLVLAAIREGWDVAFTYYKNEIEAQHILQEAEKISANNKVRCYQLDVKQSVQVETVFDKVMDDFDEVTAVISNAGINDNSLLYNMNNDQWHDVLETNLTGSFFVARQFLQAFIAQKTGRFVFMSSIIKEGGTGQANYSASKAGLVGLSGTIAKEYGAKGICSNVVVPGFFDTDMTRETMHDELKKFWLQYCPLHRLGQLEEITKLVLFLANKNNGFVNGQVISSTGGLDWSY